MKHHEWLLAGIGACGLLLFGMTAPAQQNRSANRLTSADSTFAIKAAQGGMAEVQLGQLARDRGHHPAVREFGQRMIDDHTKANHELQDLASRRGMTLPTSLDAKDQATYDRLSKLSGAEFDRAYMRDMVTDHRTDVAEFRRQSEHGADPDLKAFAGRMLPTLEEHLRLAEQTEAKVSGER